MGDEEKTGQQHCSPFQNGLIWPTGSEDVRRREQIRLYRIAQGKVPWYCHKSTQVGEAFVGVLFVLVGMLLGVRTARMADHFLIILGLASILGGLVVLLETLILLPRRLRCLPAMSAAALKHRWLAGEYLVASEPREEPR